MLIHVFPSSLCKWCQVTYRFHEKICAHYLSLALPLEHSLWRLYMCAQIRWTPHIATMMTVPSATHPHSGKKPPVDCRREFPHPDPWNIFRRIFRVHANLGATRPYFTESECRCASYCRVMPAHMRTRAYTPTYRHLLCSISDTFTKDAHTSPSQIFIMPCSRS